MAMGDGTHKLPVKADVRKAIGKEAGDTATVRLEERARLVDGSLDRGIAATALDRRCCLAQLPRKAAP